MVSILQFLSSDFLGTGFWAPIRKFFKLREIRKTTTNWGWLQAFKGYDFVPCKKPGNLPPSLHKWFASQILLIL
jgi:hypothetical protein